MRHALISTAAAVVTAAGAATPALASSYDYLETRYTFHGDADGGDVTGFGVEASRSFDELLFARLSADMYDLDASGDADVPVDLFSIGPGIRYPLTGGRRTVDLWGQLNYQRVAAGGSSSTALGVDAGLQMQLTDEIDGRLTGTWVDDNDVDMDLIEVKVNYALNRDFDLTGSIINGEVGVDGSTADLENLLRIGVRFRF